MGFRPATRSEINLASKVAHICTLLGFAILKSSFAWAALDPTLPPGATSSIPKFDLNTIIPASVAGTVLKTLAILTDHRSYEGATPQGLLGFRIGAEATLVHLPNDFGSTLQTLGVGGASTEAVALPIARLHVSKGIGANTDVGISGLYYKGNYIMGGDIKYTFYQPEEGVTWAWRLGYSATYLDTQLIGLNTLKLKPDGVYIGEAFMRVRTRAISPQIVASKQLEFAEPYIGGGIEWTQGQIEIPYSFRVVGSTEVLATNSYTSLGGNGFTGVSFRMPHLGLRLALEMNYSTIGTHHMGVIVGIAF